MRELHIRVESGAISMRVELQRLDGKECVSQLFRFELDVVAPADVEVDERAILATPAELVFERGTFELRRIHGRIVEVRDRLHTEARHQSYRLVFVPRLWELSQHEMTEVFVGLSITDVIKAKLERIGFQQGQDFEFRLIGKYAARDLVVQYQETSLQFVSRLAEHWGIFFFFEHHEGRDVVVFGDHNEAMKEPTGGSSAPFFQRGDETGVFELEVTTKTLPSRVVCTDYNYRTPHVPLLGEANVTDGSGQIIEHGAHFKTPDEANAVAQIRAEELRTTQRVFEGRSDLTTLIPGTHIKLEGHPRGDIDLLLLEVRHKAELVALGTARDNARQYVNELRAIDRSVAYRPPRLTPKPRIHGSITATIESEQKGGYAELDEHGRYTIRFKSDTSGSADTRASHRVRMAQSHAGAGYGTHFPLRHGVEVLLTFIDGDPDRPIITSAVPNPQTPSTVASSNGRRNVIRTGGGNEINIDDTKGLERIKISTPFGGTALQLGAPNTPEAGSALTTSGASTAVAGAGVSTLTSVSTLMSDIASVFAAVNIVDFAGVKGILAAIKDGTGEKIIKDIIDVGKNALDIPKKYEEGHQKDLESDAAEKEAAAGDARKEANRWADYDMNAHPEVTQPDGTKRPMTREEWDASHPDHQKANQMTKQATGAKQRAEANKKRLADEEKDPAQKTKDKAKKAGKMFLDTVEAGEKLAKAGKSLLSDATKAAQEAVSTGVAATVQGMATAAGGIASVPRVPGVVAPIGSPFNIQGAAVTAALVGTVNAFVCGPVNATVSAVGGQAILAGGAAALVKSPGIAELAGSARALITSGVVVDIFAGATLDAVAGGKASIRAGTQMLLNAGSSMQLMALGALTAKANASVDVKAAGGAVSIEGSGGIRGKGPSVSLNASNAFEAKAGSKADVLAGSWGLRATSGKAVVGSGASVCVLDGGSALLKKGGDAVECKGGVTVKGSSVKIKGSGTVSVKGSRVDLG